MIERRTAPADERFRALLQAIPAPDFPSGGTIVGREGIYRAYQEGRGGFVVRGKADVRGAQEGRSRVDRHHRDSVSGQQGDAGRGNRRARPRQEASKASRTCATSPSRDGMRIVIELKRGELPDVVLNNLYKHTKLQMSYGITLLAIVGAAGRAC